MRSDRVTPSMRAYVLHRDGYRCQAPTIDPSQAGTCRSKWGYPITRWLAMDDGDKLTLHHVNTGGGGMGLRAPSDPEHLLTLCWWHHLGYAAGSNWATKSVTSIREHLRRIV